MSGHSKWATTKHKKAIIDAKRGKIFTKLGRLITIAARDGKSGDLSSNPSLRMAVENAKAASMPKDNIERAIQRGIGGAAGAQIEEIIYEAYAPGGIALMIECLTDNKNRTLGEIKAILNKSGGSLANAGSVAYQFTKTGQIIVDKSKNEKNQEKLEEAIIESGAKDFEEEENVIVIETAPPDLFQVRKFLEDSGIVIESSELANFPNNPIDLDEDKKKSIIDLVEKLEDLDDVNNVYSNLNL